MRKLLILTLVSGLAAGSAAANTSLRNIPDIENGLFTISVADKIRRECGSISARIFKARSELQSLYNFARQRGYSEAEIDAYVNDDAEKKRMRAKRDAYLASKGVVKSQPKTYCAAGRTEIKNSTRIGALLRAR
jgi:hypothetical protein